MSCARQEEGQTPAKSPLPGRHGSSAAQNTLTAVPGDRESTSGRLLLLFWLFKCALSLLVSVLRQRSGIVDDSTFFKVL